MRLPGIRRVLRFLSPFLVFATPLSATWSIVAVNTRTGEVAVASATCLTGTNLRSSVPAVLVGLGAGAAQSSGDPTGQLRQIMVQGFRDGLTSQEILEQIEVSGIGSLEDQQFGIVSAVGDPVTRTGTSNGRAALGVVGEVDGIRYSIQGNVLAGNRVVRRTETTFREAAGDLSQRIMAAMETAREFGGDGRCSCSQREPTSCGSPPPSFQKSAHVGFVVVARIGDVDGDCVASGQGGCASGDYWLNLNVIGGTASQDPVITLTNRFANFRRNLSGLPDGTLSSLAGQVPNLPADGRTTAELELVLRDLDGVPLDQGGAAVTATSDDGAVASVRAITDLGNGRYRIEVAAGTQPGAVRLAIQAAMGNVSARVYPDPVVRVEPVTPLFCGFDTAEATTASVPLVLNVPEAAGRPYVLLASGSGTVPGLPLAGGVLPLNPDRLFGVSHGAVGQAFLVGGRGLLDGAGHARATFLVPPAVAAGLVGARVDCAAVVFDSPPRTTNADGFDVLSAQPRTSVASGPSTGMR